MSSQPIKRILMVFLLCIFAANAQVAGAQDRQAMSVQLLNVKINPLVDGAQLVITLSGEPQYRIMLLDVPMRLVIDLDKTSLAAALNLDEADNFAAHAIVKNLRYGLDGVGGVRLVVEAGAAFTMAQPKLEPLHETIWQLVITLSLASSRQDFVAQMAEIGQEFSPRPATQQTSHVEILTQKSKRGTHPFTIVLDAGHGGSDSGAKGISGILEKEVTLSFSRTLREALLRENPDFVVYLTREEDVFLRLNERVEKARSLDADLFVSIHADSIHIPNVRGATIYTISSKASDALAKAIADNENKVDLLDEVTEDESREVIDILLDLARRETDALSLSFADRLIEHLQRAGVRLIKPAHRYAGFMVLRAPDIPSVLVELGYLSNPHDETLITDPLWRAGVATIMAQAIKEYARDHISTTGE